MEQAARPAAKDRAESNAYAPAPRVRPLAPVLASLRDDAARWQRAGSARPMDTDGALVRWLAELDAASAGLWVATDAARARAASIMRASALVLQRDGTASACEPACRP